MAEANRKQLKKVDAAKLQESVYEATFTNGTTVTCAIDAIPESVKGAMVARFLQYGLKQKLDDSMAGAETVEEAIEELTSTWDAIVAGNWTIRIPGEGVEGGLFARAYAEFHGLSLSDAKAKIQALIAKNLEKAQAKLAGVKDAPEVTERQVFNKIRDVAFERYPDLKVKYDEIKAKKAARKSAKPTAGLDEIDLA